MYSSSAEVERLLSQLSYDEKGANIKKREIPCDDLGTIHYSRIILLCPSISRRTDLSERSGAGGAGRALQRHARSQGVSVTDVRRCAGVAFENPRSACSARVEAFSSVEKL